MSDEVKQESQPQEVKVLIIAHKKNQFVNAAQFLARRGVPCAVKGNVREGIQYITKEKPTVVFLSWNLPNSNIVKTYQLITQALKADCVVFAEKSDGKTAAELNNSKIPEAMHAPVSGPGFFMRLQKLIKAKEEAKNSSSRPEKNTAAASQKKKTKSARIKIKTVKEIPKEGTWEQTGVDAETGDPIYTFMTSGGQSMDGKKGLYTFKGKNPPTLKDDGTWDTDSGEFGFEEEIEFNDDTSNVINFQTNNPKYNENDYEAESSDPSLNNIDDLLNSAELSDLSATTENSAKSDLIADGHGDGAQADEVDIEVTKHSKDYGSVLNVAKNKGSKDYDLPQYEKTEPKESLILGDGKNSKYKVRESMIVEPEVKSKTPNSILLNQAIEALKSSVRPAKTDHKLVDKVSKAKVLNIQSNRFKGYLICVIPMFYEMDRTVFAKLKENLAKLLKDQGEDLRHFEELNVDLEQIDFKQWCDENTEFTIATLDGEQEIVVAYAPVDQTLPQVEENDKTVMVKAQDLAPDTKTKFNLFLHLPKNNKLIRYLKTGDSVTNNHTEKFEKHKVGNLHIKKEEVHSFKEYFATNQIQKKSKKKKAS